MLLPVNARQKFVMDIVINRRTYIQLAIELADIRKRVLPGLGLTRYSQLGARIPFDGDGPSESKSVYS